MRLRNRKGFFLIELLIGAGLIAVLSIMVMEGWKASNDIGFNQENEAEATSLLDYYCDAFKEGYEGTFPVQGKLKSGESYTITAMHDQYSYQPLEKVEFIIKWNNKGKKKSVVRMQ